jgi:hypothetical protein
MPQRRHSSILIAGRFDVGEFCAATHTLPLSRKGNHWFLPDWSSTGVIDRGVFHHHVRSLTARPYQVAILTYDSKSSDVRLDKVALRRVGLREPDRHYRIKSMDERFSSNHAVSLLPLGEGSLDCRKRLIIWLNFGHYPLAFAARPARTVRVPPISR